MAVRPRTEIRLFAFAGLHLDASFPWATAGEGRRGRLERQLALDAICAVAAAEADVLVSAGDLYDQDRHHPDTQELLRESFAGIAPVPVVLVPGDTDPKGRLSLYERTDWPENVHVLGLLDDPESVEVVPGLVIWGAAAPGAFDQFTAPAGGVHLGLTRWPAPENDRTGLHHVITGQHYEPATTARVTCPGAAQPFAPDDESGSAALLSVYDDGTVSVGWRNLGGRSPEAPPHRFPSDGLRDFDLALLGEEQTVRGEFVRDLLAATEPADPHVRRLALLSGLRALAGVKPLIGSQSTRERNGGRR
jgi:hypothetical protein